MRFSVIVPVFNTEDYLRQCVDSILSQEYCNFEVILVDDGSLDHCPQICDYYAETDDRVKVVHQKNGGASAARNTGIRTAVGDYLLFIDSDDYWNSSLVLNKIYNTLKKRQVEIVHFGREFVYPNCSEIVRVRRSMSSYSALNSVDTISALVSENKLTIHTGVMAVSRKFILENALFFKNGIKVEDLEWAIRLYLCEPRWEFLDDYFYVYRCARDGSITSSVDYEHLCDYCGILETSVLMVSSTQSKSKYALMSYLMYHALICSANIYWLNLPKKQRMELLSRMEAVCKNRLLHYTMSKKVRFAGYIYRICGFDIMARLLGFYLKHRGVVERI